MKRNQIIMLLWGLWLFSLIGAYFGIEHYIDTKRNRLHSETYDRIKALFDGQSSAGAFINDNDGFFDEDFSRNPVKHYKKIKIPTRPNKMAKQGNNLNLPDVDPELLKSLDEESAERWKDEYGDLASLYELNWGDKFPNQNDEGWNIIRTCFVGGYDNMIETNIIFPYKVGLKKTEWENFYTVEQAVNEAFEFYATNEKSSFSDRFQKGSNRRLWSQIYDCCNEYFTIVENENYGGYTVGTPIYQPEGKSYEEAQRISPYEDGWMHNGYYRVFIAATQKKHFVMKELEWAASKDRKTYVLWWGIGISVLFLSMIIPLTILQMQSNKRKSESLYQKLCRLCNPKEFVKNYDKDKVAKANALYKILMETKPDDKNALMQISEEAISELGTTLIDEEKKNELKEKVNPQRFMSPYDAEKVALANELFAILSKEGITYTEFTEVEEKSKALKL